MHPSICIAMCAVCLTETKYYLEPTETATFLKEHNFEIID